MKISNIEEQNNTIYKDAIDILTSQGKFYINLGLERCQEILKLLGNPEKKLQFIHVAGTNGKGSVCAILSSILANNHKSFEQTCKPSGNPTLKVGLFTSPHVFDYTERIKINDAEIDKETFGKNIIKITELAKENEIHLTEFEIITVVALEYFAQNNVDIVILETGLGGRLDATNVIEKNICSIITNIDLDHTERLGSTIEKIAFEKAGIIKKKCSVVISSNNAGFDVIKRVAKERHSDLILSNDLLCHCEEFCDDTIHENEAFGLPHGYGVPTRNDSKINSEILTLKGKHQKENLSLVLSAIEILDKNGFEISRESIETGLKNVKHPCRFEYLKDKNILIDGAHNPNGTKVLRESLDYYFPNQKFNFIFGCLRNKNYKEMMKNIFSVGDNIYFYHFDNENSCSYEELASACEFNSKPFAEFKKDANTLTVICGSFYMIKELLTKMGIK